MTQSSDINRCRREIAAIEVDILFGNLDLQGLCLALADWHAELPLLQNEKRRRAETQRRECGQTGTGQALME